MKKIITATLGILLLISCSEDETSTNPTNPTTETKIYFDGYNDDIGSMGIKWNELYSVNIDGTGQQQITNYSINGTIDRYSEHPIISLDGTKIIFAGNNDDSDGELFTMNLNGTNLTRITDNSGNYISNHLLFQNGTKLIFDKEDYISPDKFGEIYSSNLDGTNEAKLTNFPIDGSCSDASVNPTNTLIAYSCEINSIESQIYTMSLNGSNKQILTTNNTLFKTRPKYSNDGNKIVFYGRVASTINKHSEIFIMNSNGSNITQLTNYSSNGTLGTASRDAVFSNDGTKIYFVSDESGISQIYKMNVDGSGKTKLTNSPEDKSNPFVK